MTLEHTEAKGLIGGLLKEISSTKQGSLILANVYQANPVLSSLANVKNLGNMTPVRAVVELP
jgi:hypothetical protein